MKAPTIAVLGWIAGLILLLHPRQTMAEANCLDCHQDAIAASRFDSSVHGPKSGAGAEARLEACTLCHGAIKATADGHPKPPKVDCEQCHSTVRDRLKGSAHFDKNQDAPAVGCTDCHGTHYIQRVSTGNQAAKKQLTQEGCGNCHDKAKAEYNNSSHGKSQSTKVATCVDCHGGHTILPHKDPASATFRLNQSGMCAACHTNAERGFSQAQIKKVKEYLSSSHGLAITKSGLLLAATCVDCHGAHAIKQAASSAAGVARSHIPQTCGTCHAGVTKLYLESVHGQPFQKGNTDVPVCIDCHRSHQIRSHFDPISSVYATNVSTTCLKCHSNAQFINRYNFPGLREKTYLESYHGAASKLGDTKTANCGSCHGYHDIYRSNDPRSAVNPANMAKTCGKCHHAKDPSKPMAVGKIHLTTAKESHWIVDMVRKTYIGLISGTMGFFLFFIAIDLRRHRRHHKKR